MEPAKCKSSASIIVLTSSYSWLVSTVPKLFYYLFQTIFLSRNCIYEFVFLFGQIQCIMVFMWKVNRLHMLQWQLMFLKMVKPRSHWIANSEIRSGTVLRCITVRQNVIKGNWVLCRQFATVLDAGVSSPLRKLGIWWVYQGKATFKAHLHCIRDLGPSVRVRARTQSKQVNWCFVFTLIRVLVRDFCLGRPCPSLSLHVAISSDADVWVRPRLWNGHAQSHLFTWSLPNLVQNGRGLRWPRIRASDIV